MSAVDDDRLARIGLSRLLEPDDRAVRALIAEVGATAVWNAVADDAAARGGLAALLGGDAAADAVLPRSVERTLTRYRASAPTTAAALGAWRAAEAAGIRVLCPADDAWPGAFDELGPDAPVCLWTRGPLPVADVAARAVAVVGSRAATGYGVHVAGEFGYELAGAGWAVVSGAAYGIDGAAHRGALAADGVTVAVLACGVDIAYPRGHATLLDRVAETGLVVSEWPPGSAPYARRFLWRNRLIAALSSAVVVVEAAARSGAMSTAHYAAEYGRPVLAVPGPVTSAMSISCHQLLREGATCVTCAAEVIEAASPMGTAMAEPPRGSADPRDDLSPIERRAIEAVPARHTAAIEAVAVEAGLTSGEARSALARLELAGFVERDDGGWRLSKAERARVRGDRRRPRAAAADIEPRDADNARRAAGDA
jgi:DNA processing protein